MTNRSPSKRQTLKTACGSGHREPEKAGWILRACEALVISLIQMVASKPGERSFLSF